MIKNICWICGNKADSAEHKYKKTDITRLYGRNFTGNEPIYVSNNQAKKPQGPNSSDFKYEKSLCQHCNNEFTQPFDRAYEIFIKWIFGNKDYITSKRIIDFSKIYGEKFAESQLNLFRYFAKAFGCELSGYSNPPMPVPNDIVELMYKQIFLTRFAVTFSVTEDMTNNEIYDEFKIMGKGSLYYRYNDETNEYSYKGHNYLLWLNVHFWYSWEPEPLLGSKWIGDKQAVYVGTMETNNSFWETFDKTKHLFK
mgnify:CR=1 FL=1